MSRRQLAELFWLTSHQNILQFLETIPKNRQHYLSFEDLMGNTKDEINNLCEFLGIEFVPEMLNPYSKNANESMTDGIYKDGIMIGDVKFHTHDKINTDVANAWRKNYKENFLGNITNKLAMEYGYFVDENYSLNNGEIDELHDSLEGLSESEITEILIKKLKND